MPEKKAKGFAFSDKDQVFDIKSEKDDKNKDRIVLTIEGTEPKKILLQDNVSPVSLTGNPIIDYFNKINQSFIDHSKIKVKALASFFRLLSVMLNAGLPLIKSLRTLAVQSEKNPKLSKVLYKMADLVESGKSLSGAMSEFPEVFQEAQIGVVKSGEVSGQLNNVLKSLAEQLEKTASITGKVKGALIYPIVILTLLVIAIFLMMIMVIPQLTSLFSQVDQELPLPTRILIAVSDFSVNYWYIVILGVVGFFVAFSLWKKTRSGRYIVDYMKLKVPIFGNVIQKAILSKFARSFSNLMTSGIPIVKAIEIVAESVGNEVYKRRFMLTAEDMRHGIPMAENLSNSKLFPTMLVNMIEIGEQTAQLDTVMLKVADFYDEEIDTVVAALSKTMEPLILVIIGVTVGGLVAAIMLPIMQLTNVAGSLG